LTPFSLIDLSNNRFITDNRSAVLITIPLYFFNTLAQFW